MKIDKEMLKEMISYIPDDVLIKYYNESSDLDISKVYQAEIVKRLASMDSENTLMEKLGVFSKINDEEFYKKLEEGCKSKIAEFDAQEQENIANEKLKFKESLSSFSDLGELHNSAGFSDFESDAKSLIADYLVENPALFEGADTGVLLSMYEKYNSEEIDSMVSVELLKGSMGSELDEILLFLGKSSVDFEYKSNVLKFANNINNFLVSFGRVSIEEFHKKTADYVELLMSQADTDVARAANMLVPFIQGECTTRFFSLPMSSLAVFYDENINSAIDVFRIDLLSVSKAHLYGKSLSEISHANSLDYNSDYEEYLLYTIEGTDNRNLVFVDKMIDELIAIDSDYVKDNFREIREEVFMNSLSSEMDNLLSAKSKTLKSEVQTKK